MAFYAGTWSVRSGTVSPLAWYIWFLSADGAPQLSRRGSAALAGPDLFHNADADCNENYNQQCGTRAKLLSLTPTRRSTGAPALAPARRGTLARCAALLSCCVLRSEE